MDATALMTIAQACRDSERLRFGYTARSGEQTERLVEPYRLVPLRGRWYLVAWDTARGDWRTFRVDRTAGVVVTGARFRPRELPAPDAATFVRERLDAVPARYHTVVDIRAPADEVAREVSRWGEVQPLDSHSCRLVMDVDTVDWVVIMLAAIGADFVVVEPEELREHLRRVGTLFLRATEPAPAITAPAPRHR